MGCMGAQPTEKKAARTPLKMTMAHSPDANESSREPGELEKGACRIDGGAMSKICAKRT
jgi:hypothetical protein